MDRTTTQQQYGVSTNKRIENTPPLSKEEREPITDNKHARKQSSTTRDDRVESKKAVRIIVEYEDGAKEYLVGDDANKFIEYYWDMDEDLMYNKGHRTPYFDWKPC
jgi:hypothetical protein